jgi:hypothetical protein
MMRVFGKRISNWWLLSLPPILIVVFPALLMLFFMGNNLAGAIFGPPAIWNRTWRTPPQSDLVGKYSESERHWDAPSTHPPASLTLNADQSMIVANLPFEFADQVCILSGKGSWRGPDEDQKIDLILTSDGSTGSCKSDSYSFLELSGHSKPYSLYWVLGDPDSGTGVWLTKD